MSVLKVMLLVAYLRRDDVRGRALRPADRALLAPMIRWSDSVAASRVRDIVGNDGLARLARRAGMRHFQAAPIWGNSIVNASDQSRFLLHIERLLPPRHRRAALRLLGSIVHSQRWGIARVRPPGWALYFKSGWGSGSGAADHQVALLRRGGRRLSVAIMTTSNPSHAYAEATEQGSRGAAVCEASAPRPFPPTRLRRHGPDPVAIGRDLPRRAPLLARGQPPG